MSGVVGGSGAGRGIRIWHQSITDLSVLPGYAAGLGETARRIAAPGTVVDVHGVAPGSYPAGVSPIEALRSRWNEHLLTTQVIAAAIEAEAGGYDAVTVSCFYDPGLRAARDAVGIPVVSACETSLTTSIPLGSQAVLVALDEWQAEALRALVVAYGLRDRVRAVVPVVPEITELELEAGMPAEELERRLGAAVARAGGGPGTVVVPAEGFLNSVVVGAGIRSLAGMPVIDSFASLLLHAELLVRLGRAGGADGFGASRGGGGKGEQMREPHQFDPLRAAATDSLRRPAGRARES